MQTYIPPSGGGHVSVLHVLRTTIAESGVRSLFTGISASIFRQMTYSLVRIGAYENMKYRLSKDGQKPSSGKLLLAAMAAGGLGGMAGNPADVLLVRMTSDSIRPPEKRFNYPNALSGLVSLMRNEGWQGLTRGIGTNTVRCSSWRSRCAIIHLRPIVPSYPDERITSGIVSTLYSCLS